MTGILQTVMQGLPVVQGSTPNPGPVEGGSCDCCYTRAVQGAEWARGQSCDRVPRQGRRCAMEELCDDAESKAK